MKSKPISPLIKQSAFEAPIPGQSLTNSPENSYAWEKPPEMVDLNVARQKIFLNLLEPKNLEEIQKLMINEVPVDAIAQTVLVEGFRQGKFNPDLALQLLEPTMYMLLAIAEKSGIEPTLDAAGEEDDEDSIAGEGKMPPQLKAYHDKKAGKKDKKDMKEAIQISADTPEEAGMMMQILKLAGVQPVDAKMIGDDVKIIYTRNAN